VAAGSTTDGVAAEGDGSMAGLGVDFDDATGTDAAGVTAGDCFASIPVVCCFVLLDSKFPVLGGAVGFPLELSRWLASLVLFFGAGVDSPPSLFSAGFVSSCSFIKCINSFVCLAVSVEAHAALSDSSYCDRDATISFDICFSGNAGFFTRMALSLTGRATEATLERESFVPDKLSLIFGAEDDPGIGVEFEVDCASALSSRRASWNVSLILPNSAWKLG
jgi:hypothetical protein